MRDTSNNKADTTEDLFEELKESNRDFFDLLKYAVCGICVYKVSENNELKLQYMSNGYCELCEGTQEQLFQAYQKDSMYGVCEEEQNRVREVMTQVIHTKKNGELTYQARTITGKKKWCTLQVSASGVGEHADVVYATFYDVTSQIVIQEKLRESEQTLEMATENIGLWHWVYDWKNDVAYTGKLLQKDFDIPYIVENYEKKWAKRDLICSPYKEDYRKMIAAIRNGEKRCSIDAKTNFPDGTVHWVRYLMRNLYEEKNPTKAIVTARIIDDVKELGEKYENERRKSMFGDDNLLSHASFNLTQNYVTDFHGDNVVPECDGNVSIDSLGQMIEKYIQNPEKRQEYIEMHQRDTLLAEYEKGKDEVSIDYQRKMPDGKLMWVRTLFHMMREADSTDVLLFDYCYNINKQKIMTTMMDFVVNDDYDLIGSVNFIDNNALMIFGEDSYNITGKDFVEEDYTESLKRFCQNAVVKDEREDYMRKASIDNVKKVLQSQNSFEFYIHVKKPEDKDVHAKKIRYFRFDNGAEGCLFTQTDITLLVEEEKRKQDQLKRALEGAESANHSKTAFLSQMSHEIRTPMNAIIGMTQLARDTTSIREKNEYLQKINSSSYFLLGIINDILDMSRIESGRFELHPTWVSSYEILDSCITMLKPEMEKKNITFTYPAVKEMANVEYYVDALRFQQIYMNVLNNAVKFTPEGGSIKLEISNIRHDDHTSMDMIKVTDTGCGMSEEFLSRIFTPFEQERSEYSKNIQGTGLGLALVKQIVTAMGGEINVQSEPEKGSVFSFSIPYEYRKSTKKPKVMSERIVIDLFGKKVLLVDDHPLNREIAKKLLEKQGMIVEQAVDGHQAVNMFSQSALWHYDAVLMDIRMPVMDGLEATKAIRKCDRADACAIPIIAMTANAFDEDVRISLRAGMNAHLAKPIEPKVLFATLAHWIAIAEETE